MILGKTLLCCITLSAALMSAGNFALAAPAKDCKEPEAGSNEAPIFSPPLLNVVTGQGRLQFYAAPNIHCPMAGVFVIPKDELIAYAQTDDGWSSVMYTNPKSGDHVEGWVRSTRLKETGAIAPKQ